MNINLIKNLFENSRNSSKVINRIFNRSKLCSKRLLSHSNISIGQHVCYSTKQGILYNECFKRRYSDQKPPINRLPPLMPFPHLVWPTTFNVFQSFLLTTFLIKPFYDSEFRIADFVKGSRKALEVWVKYS